MLIIISVLDSSQLSFLITWKQLCQLIKLHFSLISNNMLCLFFRFSRNRSIIYKHNSKNTKKIIQVTYSVTTSPNAFGGLITFTVYF